MVDDHGVEGGTHKMLWQSMKVGDLVTHKDIEDIGPGLVIAMAPGHAVEKLPSTMSDWRSSHPHPKSQENVLVFWSDLRMGTTFQYAHGLHLINESKE